MPLHWRSLLLSQRFSLRFFSALKRASREWKREGRKSFPLSTPLRDSFSRLRDSLSLTQRKISRKTSQSKTRVCVLSCNDNIDVKREGGKQLYNLCEMNSLPWSSIFGHLLIHVFPLHGGKNALALNPSSEPVSKHPSSPHLSDTTGSSAAQNHENTRWNTKRKVFVQKETITDITDTYNMSVRSPEWEKYIVDNVSTCIMSSDSIKIWLLTWLVS